MTDLISLEKIAQWQKLKTLVLDRVSSPITKCVYSVALTEIRNLGRRGFTFRGIAATLNDHGHRTRPGRTGGWNRWLESQSRTRKSPRPRLPAHNAD